MKANSVVICAIVGLVLIEIVALFLGFNGQGLRWVTILIAGLAGWRVPKSLNNTNKSFFNGR